MEPNTAVWVIDTELGWCAGSVTKKNALGKGKVEVVVRNDQTRAESKFILNDNDEDHNQVKLQNKTQSSVVDNLINLLILNEPTILHCLQLRYNEDKIYTYTGPILIALNPFKIIPGIYDPKTLDVYYNFGILKSQGLLEAATSATLAPHVFAIADGAFRNMMTAIETRDSNVDQSILISGESGAGKTETTKLMLRYLTTVSIGNVTDVAVRGSVMDKVLQSNPILESFGNAKTVRNDNSSRFGKYIELHFNRKGNLIGGFIRSYLLEKVRIVTQQTGERNYHIFYQIAKSGSPEEVSAWKLPPLQSIKCANQGGVFELAHIDDVEDQHEVRIALETLEFPVEMRRALFDAVAALIHFGQLDFSPANDGEASVLSADKAVQASMETAAKLLGVGVAGLTKAMVKRTASNKSFEKDLNPAQAAHARDGLTKGIYGRIFNWLVLRINEELEAEEKGGIEATIGVLDIFGFESFKENSFEQLCINYTNESLQQQFNKFVFELEQIEYKAEGINWSFIDFPSNQDCLDLIGLKGKSIFAALDDECMIPKGSDSNFATKMYTSMSAAYPKRFSATQPQRLKFQFSVNHYAGLVVYSTELFMEKNKDEIPSEATELFSASTVELLRVVFKEPSAGSSPNSKIKSTGTVTVCTQFREQLTSLMDKINKTKPHYVRCLKPNDKNKPDIFDRLRITEQLKYGGVLEAVRVARAGFPMRETLPRFYEHYRPVANPFNPVTETLPKTIDAGDLPTVSKLLTALWDDTSLPAHGDPLAEKKLQLMKVWRGKSSTANIPMEHVQLGKTKVFMRRPPYDLLEGRKARFNYLYASRIQKQMRGVVVRKWYKSAKWSITFLQRWVRSFKLRVEIRRRIDKKRSKGISAPAYVAPPPKKKPSKVVAPPPPAPTEEKDDTPAFQYASSYDPNRRIRQNSSYYDYTVPEAKPAVVVSRKLLTQDKKSDKGEIDDALYYWLFGTQSVRSAPAPTRRTSVIREIEERSGAKSASAIKPPPPIKAAPAISNAHNPMFAKPTAKSVAAPVRPTGPGAGMNRSSSGLGPGPGYTGTLKPKKKQLGNFGTYKKNATVEEKEEYKKQFPSAWSTGSFARFF